MSEHIDNVKRAIEFKKPAYLPMETNHVPHIYNAYHTLCPDEVQFIPGTEDFDSFWPLTYSWFFEEIGKNEQNETIYLDQFGTKLKIPNNMNSTYALLEHPLEKSSNYKEYKFPDPKNIEKKYTELKKVVDKYYPDRFFNGFIDPGFYLTTNLILGIQNFFMKVATDIDLVIDIYEKAIDYYKQIAVYFKNAGAHMITVIEDWGQNSGMVINPIVWRNEFKPRLKKFYKYVHDLGLYTSICMDGNTESIHKDLLDMGIDLFFIPDVNTTGIKKLKENLAGKICLKTSIDMLDTLATGTPAEVKKEADELVRELSTPDGGFICEVVKWYRPEYNDANVAASVEAFNKYRKR